MKVPKMYKSSVLYDAGTDVIYNDESKLQYAPFIYATTQSGDGGGDEGGDSMVVIYDSQTGTINKSFKQLKDAVDNDKIVVLKEVTLDDETGFASRINYLTYLDHQSEGQYNAYFASANIIVGEEVLTILELAAANETDNMAAPNP